jgi:cellulose biosynthesis protein BcsQ
LDKIVAQINQEGKNLALKLNMVYQPVKQLGIVFTRVKIASNNNPVILHRRIIQELNEIKRDNCFQNFISDSILVPEAIEAGIPVEFYSNKRADQIKLQFKNFSGEVLSRIPNL